MSESKLELSIALSENENTRAILDGRISPDAIKLHPTARSIQTVDDPGGDSRHAHRIVGGALDVHERHVPF